MRLKVIVPFRYQGAVLKAGQLIEANGAEAARLLDYRVVKMVPAEKAVRPPAEKPETPEPERAVKPPAERRTRKRKVDDRTAASHPAGD